MPCYDLVNPRSRSATVGPKAANHMQAFGAQRSLLPAGTVTNSMNGFALVASCPVWGRHTAIGSGATASAPVLLSETAILYPLLTSKHLTARFPWGSARGGRRFVAIFLPNH